ncbi:MAG: cupin domain-containing protein [Firmicutes bacterium]|nr:cupin domain-containing protein [Bacillota bacterium]
MIVKRTQVTATNAGPGVERRVMASDGSLMLVEVSFKKGSVGEVHNHPHEQVSYVAKGSIELQIGEEKQVLKAGDSFYVAPDVPHAVVALEGTVLIDIFSPQREDFR